MRRRSSRWFAILFIPAIACYRPREMAPQIPLEGIDGKYTFTISQPFKMDGRFMVSHSKAYLMEPRRCVPIEGPKSSDELRASWFECVAGSQGRPSGASLRLRISEVDPINMSRWYQRTLKLDTLGRCNRMVFPHCRPGTMVYGQRWIDRNGAITVLRGWPLAADTGVAPDARGRGQLRARCDTSTALSMCQPNENREAR